jgi:protein tyrosine phosphatase (PTP) superfamily phosphohydrolase (DUF442 family)
VVSFCAIACHTEGQKNVAFLAGREVATDQPREDYWGQPIPLQGVPNFYRVSDDLYRGDEPSPGGMRRLEHIGIRTIVNVRSWAAHGTQGRMQGLGMKYMNIPMVAWQPRDVEVIQFLRIMGAPDNRPVFLHCYTGGDRVGLLTAIYRVAFCGWPKSEARNEMLYGGYGFHQVLVQYLVTYFDQLDIEALKAKAGLTDANIAPADRAVSWPVIQASRRAAPARQSLAGEWPGAYNGEHEKKAGTAAHAGADRGGNVPGDDVALPRRPVRRQHDP